MTDREIEASGVVMDLVRKYGLVVEDFKSRTDSNDYVERYYTLRLNWNKDGVSLVKVVYASFHSHCDVTVRISCGYEDYRDIFIYSGDEDILHYILDAVEKYDEEREKTQEDEKEQFLRNFIEQAREEIGVYEKNERHND